MSNTILTKDSEHLSYFQRVLLSKFEMKKVLLSTLAVATLLTGSFTATPPKADAGVVDSAKDIIKAVIAKFKDVKGHWAESVIAKAYDLKLISGYEDGTFRPNGKITRAEFAAILSRATKLDSATTAEPFSDLKGHWAESAVTQLIAQGFINPRDYPNGFNPNTELTRYEMIKWIANGLMKSNASFQQAFNEPKTPCFLPRKRLRAKSVPKRFLTWPWFAVLVLLRDLRMEPFAHPIQRHALKLLRFC